MNVKKPTIVGILTFICMIKFVLTWVEDEKSFIISGPGYTHLFFVLKVHYSRYPYLATVLLFNTQESKGNPYGGS